MNNDKKQKIIKTLLSLMISFLMIFIVAMFARVASNTVLPQNSKVSVLINDYLDMMMEMMDKFATNLKIKRNTVSEYQVNLITQSISDYVGYSMYQTADILKDYNPYKNYSKTELEKYKNDYYKMTLENPYLRSMTVFSIDGKMRLNLYSANHKSWPIELQDNLLKEVKNKGSLVLNAENENAFYIMEYIKNKYGEIIVTTRNDYSYVSDIAMYYQVADKRLYISDSRDLVYNVRESIGEKSIEKVSSVINRFAYYKKQPSFIVNDSLSVSMIGKEYPNYFELIVLAVTALLILLFQLILTGIINFFKYLMQIKTHRDFLESVKGENELFIDESLVKADIPKSTAIDDMPPIIEKLHYKIPEKYFDNNKKEEENNEYAHQLESKILFDAIYKDDAALIHNAISNTVDLNTRNPEGFTPLLYAIHYDKTNALNILLSYTNKIDINKTLDNYTNYYSKKGINFSGELVFDKTTPLEYAIFKGNINIVSMLMDNNADIYLEDSKGYNGIFYASAFGDYALINKILQKYPSIYNFKNSNGDSVLHIAASYGNNNAISFYLYNTFLSINTKNNEGKTPLDLANEKGYTNTVDYLIKGGAKYGNQ